MPLKVNTEFLTFLEYIPNIQYGFAHSGFNLKLLGITRILRYLEINPSLSLTLTQQFVYKLFA